jgi:putative intracellular protease/amidase
MSVLCSGACLWVGAGAEVSDSPVVSDGRIVTADGPQSAAAFGRAVIAALTSAVAQPGNTE